MRVDNYVFVCKKKIYKQPTPPLTHTQVLMQVQQENKV
jgi:hypothetical protein